MNRLILCLAALLCVASLGCNQSSFVATQNEERELFDLPNRTTPQAKQVFTRPANNYYRYQQQTHELILPSGQPGYTGRQVKTLIPDVPSGTKLPCLFYNPPGATVCTGKSAGTAEVDPMIPYVNAGFAVVIYGTDGGTVEINARTSLKSLSQQAEQYANAHAGLINARYAIDFALQQYPEIDPLRLYSIGHSSGGKQALLMAAADKRIAGCVAWAPACNISSEEATMIQSLKRFRQGLPVSLLKQSNPMLFAKRIDVPLLLVHSANDDIVPSDDVIQFGELVGSAAEIRAVPSQDHFDIPDQAFEMTARWLTRLATAEGQSLVGVKPAESAAAVRTISNEQSRRPTATRVRHSPRQSSRNNSTIQSNPFAN